MLHISHSNIHLAAAEFFRERGVESKGIALKRLYLVLSIFGMVN
jgi:hypothetical protein